MKRLPVFLVALLIGAAVLFQQCSQAEAATPYTEADALDVAVPLIAKWEGLGPTTADGQFAVAYLDVVGVATICYGHTRTAQLGQVKSIAECEALLRSEVAEYREELHAFFRPETLSSRLTPERDAAYTSLAFNVGWTGAGRSTATRRLNNGNIRGGCHALGWWNKAGGRVWRGLVNRRADETALCLQGL